MSNTSLATNLHRRQSKHSSQNMQSPEGCMRKLTREQAANTYRSSVTNKHDPES